MRRTYDPAHVLGALTIVAMLGLTAALVAVAERARNGYPDRGW